MPIAAAALAQIFGTGNGVPPTRGDQHRQQQQPGRPLLDRDLGFAVDRPAGLQLDGAICQRNLVTGSDANAVRVQSGIRETLRTGNLRGKPAIIVAGRADTLVPVHVQRAAVFRRRTRSSRARRASSRTSRCTNAQHFDAFIDNAALPGYDSRSCRCTYYFIQAMDAMWANLTQGSAAAAVAGRAHDAARRCTRRGAGDHEGERAADLRRAAAPPTRSRSRTTS